MLKEQVTADYEGASRTDVNYRDLKVPLTSHFFSLKSISFPSAKNHLEMASEANPSHSPLLLGREQGKGQFYKL